MFLWCVNGYVCARVCTHECDIIELLLSLASISTRAARIAVGDCILWLTCSISSKGCSQEPTLARTVRRFRPSDPGCCWCCCQTNSVRLYNHLAQIGFVHLQVDSMSLNSKFWKQIVIKTRFSEGESYIILQLRNTHISLTMCKHGDFKYKLN